MYNYFFRNPRLLILTVCLILVAGASSYLILPRMEDPILTNRVATINTIFPGADAERVEALITDPIEQELREIEEIKILRSRSRSGISLITINLADETVAVDEIWSRIRDKVDDATVELPDTAWEPQFREVDMKAYAMIVGLVWEQDDDPNFAILRRHAETLRDRILALRGTEKVRLVGDPDEEFIANVDPNKLAAMGLTTQDVANALRQSDAKVAAGQLRGQDNQYIIEVQGELTSMDQIHRTPIQVSSQGHVVRLEDVAEIEKGILEPASSLVLVDDRPTVALAVLVRNNQRIDHWSKSMDEVLLAYQNELPTGVALDVVFHQNAYVETRLTSLLGNLLLGAAAVISVIFLLMGWRSALIVGAALPLSSLMVLTGMRFLGIPIHQMSITGLIIAIGLLIDNAIVMVDEVKTAMQSGESPGDAVASTVHHLAIPLLGSTVTTALAFAPIALMNGPAGEFVGSIAVSVIMAIFSSLFVSMTIVPALTAWGIPVGSRGWLANGIEWSTITAWYTKSIEAVLRFPALGIALGMVLPIAGFIAWTQLPEQFFPPADRDQCQIELELPSQTSIRETEQITREIRQRILQHENVASLDWFVGESAPSFYYNVIPRRENSANYAQGLIQFKSFDRARDTIRELQKTLDNDFAQTRVLVRQLEQGPPFDAPVEIRVYGPDLDVLRDIGEELRGRLATVPHVLHTRADLSESTSKLSLQVDEEKARLVGLSHEMIAGQLQTTLEGTASGTVLEATEELPVRVRLTNASRGRLDEITSLELTSPQSATNSTGQIPLTAVAKVEMLPESATIPHRDGERMNEIQAYISAGILPANVLGAFSDKMQQQPIDLPMGYRMEFGGEAAERDDAVGNLLSSVGILLVLMVATLVLSFGSFRMSGIIGMVAGLSMGLGFLALYLFGYPFGFMAIIGSMGLMGVAINDAIVVLAGIRANPDAARGDRAAVLSVVLQTTRHIIATSLTTMAGFAPLVIAGGEFWPPMAIAISGGVAGATILALYFVPSMYLTLLCRESRAVAAQAG